MKTFREILNDDTTFRIISNPKDDIQFKRIKKLLNAIGIYSNIEKIPAKMIRENPSLGCSLSHMGALDNSVYPETKYLCLIEEDVEFSDVFNDTVLDLMIDENLLSTVDSIYLGLSAWGYTENAPTKAILNNIQTEASSFYPEYFARVLNMLSTHAILYFNKKYMNDLSINIREISLPEYKEPVDLTHARSQKENYCIALKTPMFYQSGAHEYCTKITLDV